MFCFGSYKFFKISSAKKLLGSIEKEPGASFFLVRHWGPSRRKSKLQFMYCFSKSSRISKIFVAPPALVAAGTIVKLKISFHTLIQRVTDDSKAERRLKLLARKLVPSFLKGRSCLAPNLAKA